MWCRHLADGSSPSETGPDLGGLLFRRGVASLALVLRSSFPGWSIVGLYSRYVASSHLRSAAFSIHCLFLFSLYIMHFPTPFITTCTTCTTCTCVTILGGGFSGFWFHLGYLQSMKNLNDYDYYCFSSGCLGAYILYRIVA
jgi:hypothetical protein